jgi:hypothetical protein
MLLAHDATIKHQRFFQDWLRLGVLTLGQVGHGEVIHADERVAVLCAQNAPLELEHLQPKCLCLLKFALSVVYGGQIVQASQRVGILLSKHPLLELDEAGIERLCLRILASPDVDNSQRHHSA